MPQIAAYTRMHIKQAPKTLAAAIPIKRIFRQPVYKLEEFLESQIEHMPVEEIDGDTIIAAGMIIEATYGVNIFLSGEKDLDAIAHALSKKGGCYWFFNYKHSELLQSMTSHSVDQEDILNFFSKNPEYQTEIEGINKAVCILRASVTDLDDDHVVLWSVA